MTKTSKSAIARKLNKTPLARVADIHVWQSGAVYVEAINDFDLFRFARPFVVADLTALGYQIETDLDGRGFTIFGKVAA
jgi:hypothetical protein